MKMNKITRVAIVSCASLCLAAGVAASSAQAKDDNNELVRVAQMHLADLGYDVGRSDGIMGQVTENAIMDFQRRNDLPVTGVLTPETFDMLAEKRGGEGTALYQTYEHYYHTADEEPLYVHSIVDTTPIAWTNTWHFVADRRLPLRFANLNVREEGNGTLRHYEVTVNGHPVLFADNQPGLLRVSQTFELPSEDAVIFTAYQDDSACPNRSYLLVVHGNGVFGQPYEIGNCAGSYQARVTNDALDVSFPGASLADGWQTWGTWRYQDGLVQPLS